MKPRAVMVHDGGEACVLNGSGTGLCDLNAALDAGAIIEKTFPMQRSVLLILSWDLIPAANDKLSCTGQAAQQSNECRTGKPPPARCQLERLVSCSVVILFDSNNSRG